MARIPQGREAFIAQLRERLERRPEIAFAILHGSFASGGPHRDIDVAVWVDRSARPETGWPRYAVELSAKLSVGLDTSIDVQVLNEAPLGFRYHALCGRLLFARDEELFHDLRERTWDDYFDFLPFARENLRQLLGG